MTARMIAGLALVLFLLAPAEAGEREKKLDALQEEVHRLLKEAETFDELGRHDAADRIRRKAEELQQEIHHARRRLQAERKEGGDAREILEGLEHGIGALRKLGRHEEAAHLQKIAEEVRRELGHRRKGPSEREIAEQHLEVMRLAFRALVEAKRKDAADLMEHVIHARELRLQGRRDEEALDIIRRSPGREEQVELLMLATEILQDFGAKEKAAIVWELAKRMRGDKKRKKSPKKKEKPQQFTEEHFHFLLMRIEKMEQRMKKMAAAMERMEVELRERPRR